MSFTLNTLLAEQGTSAPDLAIGILVAVASALIGYGFSIWRNRIQPWVNIIYFTDSRAHSDEIHVTTDLARATAASWFTRGLHEGKAVLNDVHEALVDSVFWIRVNSKTDQILDETIGALRAAQSDKDAAEPVRRILRNKGLSDNIEMAIARRVIVTPSYDTAKPVVLEHYPSDDKERPGFKFAFDDAVGHFGSEDTMKQGIRPRIEAFVELVSRLETEKIASMLESLKAHINGQRLAHQTIHSEAKKVIDEYSRWLASIHVTNFGSTAFVLFPEEAEFIVRGKRFRPRPVPARVIKRVEKGDDGDWMQVDGVMLIEPNATVELAVVTKEIQQNIDGGKTIRGLYDQGSGKAWCSLKVRGRELPWRRRIRSHKAQFLGK